MLRKIFDSNNNSGWIVLAIVTFALGLLISFFVPVIYSLLRFQLDSRIGYSPSEFSIWYQIVAFFAFGLGLYLVYKLNRKGSRIFGAIVGSLLFCLISYFSYNSYIYVDEDYIEVGKGYTTLKYSWEDIEELYLYGNESVEWFELVTNDGEKLEVAFGGLLDSSVMNHIRRTLKEHGVEMVDRT